MLPTSERRRMLQTLSTDEAAALEWDWRFWRRPSQTPPVGEDWVYWMMLAGRGSGKTRAGAEYVRQMKDLVSPIALVGATMDDVRNIMVEGPAGILAVSPADEAPLFEASLHRLVWPNGAVAAMFSAENPERLRGPQHAGAWCDELASWAYPSETFSNLEFGLRLGLSPKIMITTTPRPIKLVRELLADPLCRVSRTSSYSNRAHLAAAYFEKIILRHEGTRLGRQEIYAEMLDDVPGALWTRANIDEHRWPYGKDLPDLARIVVAIDPAMTSGEDADETGIIVAGKDAKGDGYVLADLSGHYQPIEWARIAVNEYHHPERMADRVVAEVNNGGDMVEATLRMVDPGIAYQAVRASRGKVVRAEPVSAMYEQGRIHHVGFFPQLEDQQIGFTVDFDRARDGSPDRVDALVWALSELLVDGASEASWDAWAKW